ncbi:unnamed protein product [Paramecium sonneborni]|uniref:Uncharacterized protein n=1 Tax=Paramecium sonneborni TaxID=65129 RepID=A0A8S1LP68_9CILI|nr:unnamed protein product [Paramecium sonneborni]
MESLENDDYTDKDDGTFLGQFRNSFLEISTYQLHKHKQKQKLNRSSNRFQIRILKYLNNKRMIQIKLNQNIYIKGRNVNKTENINIVQKSTFGNNILNTCLLYLCKQNSYARIHIFYKN